MTADDDAAGFAFSAGAVAVGAQLLVDSDSHVHRAVETVTPGRRRLAITNTLDIELEVLAEGVALVPLLPVVKGTLVTDLIVTVDGNRCPVLTRAEQPDYVAGLFAAVAAVSIRDRVTAAVAELGSGLTADEILSSLRPSLAALGRALTAPAELVAQQRQMLDESPEHGPAMQVLEGLMTAPLQGLIDLLTDQFLITAVVPAESTGRVQAELSFSVPYSFTTAGTPEPGWYKWLVEYDVAPSKSYIFPATLAQNAGSYHFRTDAPRGWRVKHQGFVLYEQDGPVLPVVSPAQVAGDEQQPEIATGHAYETMANTGRRQVHQYMSYEEWQPTLDDTKPKGVAEWSPRLGVNVEFVAHPFGPLWQSMQLTMLTLAMIILAVVYSVFWDGSDAGKFLPLVVAAPGLLSLALRDATSSSDHLAAAPLRARLAVVSSRFASVGAGAVVAVRGETAWEWVDGVAVWLAIVASAVLAALLLAVAVSIVVSFLALMPAEPDPGPNRRLARAVGRLVDRSLRPLTRGLFGAAMAALLLVGPANGWSVAALVVVAAAIWGRAMRRRVVRAWNGLADLLATWLEAREAPDDAE